MNLGQWISDYLRRPKRSQQWLATELGVSRSHINKVVKSNGTLGAGLVQRLAEITGGDEDYLNYLCGRFPRDVLEGEKLTQENFSIAIAAFRADWLDDIIDD